MKQIFALILLLSFFGCTKEKTPDPIIGNWQLEEVIADTGGRVVTTAVGNTHTASVLFTNNGDIIVKRNTTGNAFLEYLAQFSRYQTEQDGVIKFYNSNNADTMKVFFSIDNQLLLEYETRCYYAEKFVRTN